MMDTPFPVPPDANDSGLTVFFRVLRKLLGQLQQARHYYAQGLATAEKIGFRPEIALIRLCLAELDAAEGHTAEAREHLAFCIPELEAMKMRPGLEKALVLTERIDAW